MKIPLVTFTHIFHVGDLEGEPAIHDASHEGKCLSVSIHPEEWAEIAQLGGGETYRLERDTPLLLVDCHRIKKPQMAEIMKQAESIGLVSPLTMWKSWTSDESGEWCFSLYGSKIEADAANEETEKEEGNPGVSPTEEFAASPALNSYWHARNTDPTRQMSPFEVRDAVLAFAVEHTTALDGLWWQDDYDPAGLSAPRGGLFQRTLQGLRRDCEDVDVGDIPDGGPKVGQLDLTKLTAALVAANTAPSFPFKLPGEALSGTIVGEVLVK